MVGAKLLITQKMGLPSEIPLYVEHRGFEPLASTMRMLRAPNCANAPCVHYNTVWQKKKILLDFSDEKKYTVFVVLHK